MSSNPYTIDNFVKVEHVSLHYKNVQALNDVSVAFPPGKLTGMIGPDGVGKSSLLSLVTGAHAMQDGKITVLGGPINDQDFRGTIVPKIAYMPQGLGKNLYFTLTVEENLQFFARLFGQDADERRARIDTLTKSTGLYNFLDRPAGKLSGGMKQKLGLCCSLIHDPDLLVLDEPTTGVDPLARRQFWDLIDKIREQQPNMGVIVATAYMDEAQRFDWLVAMNAGKILDTGTPAEILQRTGKDNLDAAFIQLLPEEMRTGHKDLVVPPLVKDADESYAIEAENLTKQFGDFTAVNNVSFKIPQGEIFGFLGSNGCGKTTTMRMLTGLIPATSGTAKLFGKELDSNDISVRMNLGYMTQLFSLYSELTVYQNLQLYARLYRIPEVEIDKRINALVARFGLEEYRDTTPKDMPLGIKQRLSLAAAVIHNPKIVILDEPTSGVDPVARDTFWELIIELSRKDKVTIFITTHFMNEAERCDRISLMHAGRSLACDTPAGLIKARGTKTLEAAFIGCLEDADPGAKDVEKLEMPKPQESTSDGDSFLKSIESMFSFRRLYSCMWRETLELMRDPIRATLALFGAIILMFVMGYGINMDVDNLNFAVLDNDKTILSGDYVDNIASSRYFVKVKDGDLSSPNEIETMLRDDKVSMVVEIQPQFSEHVEHGGRCQVVFWIDGSFPSRAQTVEGYTEALHQQWCQKVSRMAKQGASQPLVDVQIRNLYNPAVDSLPSIVPGVIPLLLLLIPAILAALSIVREKEKGSIINLYVTPLTKAEFVIGKQIPYIGFALFSAVLLISMSVMVFDVPIKGSFIGLILACTIYCAISTAFGLLSSSLTNSQIAVIFFVMLATLLPTQMFCGMINQIPAEGAGKVIGNIYPATYMILICRGIFNKGLSLIEIMPMLLKLLVTLPVILVFAIILQRKQER